MRILVFAHDSSLYGASQSLLTALNGIMKKNEREILVLLPYKGLMEEQLSSLGINHQVLPFPRCVTPRAKATSLLNRLKRLLHYYKRLRLITPQVQEVVRNFQPDVIYTNTSVVSIGYHISQRHHIGHVWHIREFGDDFIYFPIKRSVTKSITNSTRVIFGSSALLHSWSPQKNANASIIYNGLYDSLPLKGPRSLDRSFVRIGILGALTPNKGQHVALEAFSRVIEKFPNAQLVIYGGATDRDYYRFLVHLAKRLQVADKVLFNGFVTDQGEIFQNIDVLLNCSKLEGFGRTIVEAMLQGVPVIANRAGAIPEIINDKVNGLLYSGNPDGLAHLILGLITDEKLYRDLSVNGIENAKTYSTSNYIDSIDDVLVEASNKNGERHKQAVTSI
jgi:L-malate glycosyltransferase